MIYADTSLLLPCYVPEEQSIQAQRIIETADGIAVSDLTIVEFYVGLARKVRTGTLNVVQMEESRSFFDAHLSQGLYRRVALSSDHVAAVRAFCVESKIPLRTLDALHLAAALDLGAVVATFDRRLAEASREHGLEVVPD